MDDDLNDFKLSKEAKEKLKNKKALKKELAEGKTAQEILGLSDTAMAKFYRDAYNLFEHKRFQDAAKAFLFLATLNPHHPEYWIGLGMSAQLNQDYESAIDAYELAALNDIASPIPYFYLAKCLFAIHDRESALQALEIAIDTAGDVDEFSDLKHQAEEARRILLEHDK